MKRLVLLLALLALLSPSPSAAGVAAVQDLSGIWVNPHNSVAVRAARCGDGLCGWVVWLDPQAERDARDGGVAHPLGTEVLRDYRPAGGGRWQGTVFVLDMGRRFSSTIEPLGPAALKVSGCLVGGFLCRSQIWHRG